MDSIDELVLTDVSPELCDLDRDQIVEMIKMYYAREFTVADIISKFNLSVTQGRLVTLFPPQIDDETICRHCGSPMSRKWASRASLLKGNFFSEDAVCMKCGHEIRSNSWYLCPCAMCVEERHRVQLDAEKVKQEKQKEEVDLITKVYGHERRYDHCGDIFDMSLRSAIYLLAMERQSVSNHVGLFSPVRDSEIGLAPDSELSIEILDYLEEEDTIRVDPNSSRDAFLIEGDRVRHYYYRVNYFANAGSNMVEAKQRIEDLESAFRNREWSPLWKFDWKEEIRSIWMDLSLRDCMVYLNTLGDERGFDMPKGDKTRTTILSALQDFSVSTVYSFMWSAARAASDYYMTSSVSKKQAANSVVGKIQTHADKVRIGEWNMRKYHRYKGFTNSALFEVLFYVVLQVGERGFTESIKDCLGTISWIDENGI